MKQREIDPEDLKLYVGKNHKYFLKKYSNYRSNKYFENISAIMGGPFWLLYRKLWKESFLFMISAFFVQFFLWAYLIPLLASKFLTHVVEAIVPILFLKGWSYLGTKAYFEDAEIVINKINAHFAKDDPRRLRLLRCKGGVWTPAIFLGIAFFMSAAYFILSEKQASF